MSIENKIGPYSLSGLKTFRDHDGRTCFQGNILKNGKKVAEWSEDTWGGPMMFRFDAASEQKAFLKEANKHPIAVEYKAEMEKQLGSVTNCQAELVVSTIAAEIDLEKRQKAQIKRWCKTKIVLRHPNDKEGEYLLIKGQYDSTMDAELMKRYPGVEIINKKFA